MRGNLTEPLLSQDGAAANEKTTEPKDTREPKLGYRKAIVRVEPKTFFANERTLIDWLHLEVLLATVGISLMHLDAPFAVPSGRFLCGIALLFMVHSLRVFWWRSEAIEKKLSVDYADGCGPLALVLALCVGMTFSVMASLMGFGDVGPYE